MANELKCVPVLEVWREVVVHEVVVALVVRDEGVVEVSGGIVTLGLLSLPSRSHHTYISMFHHHHCILPAFPRNFPPSHPVLEVPPVVIGDFSNDGGDGEEDKHGRDGHNNVEVVQDALFVMRRISFLQGCPIFLKTQFRSLSRS